jgi:hypothetical protein
MPSPAKIMIALCVALGLGACGDTPVDPTIAKAMQTESKTEKVQKQFVETEKKKQDEMRREKEEKAAKQEAELTAAVRLPEEMPATIEAACDAMVNAYDEFMKRGAEKDVLKWWDGRRQKLGLVRRDKCEVPNSIPAAACSTVALMDPLDSLIEIERTEAARLVIDRCMQKFAKS